LSRAAEDPRDTLQSNRADGDQEEQAHTRCPICGAGDISTFIEIDRLPVQVSALLPTAALAREAVTGQIVLAYCHRCGFVHNRRHEPDKVLFEPGYEASLAHSSIFRSYIEDLAARLIGRYDLREKSILEIGCGDGYFLRELCQLGTNYGTGIDPTIKQERSEAAGDGSVRFIADYFSDRYKHITADCICSMSVLETVPNPRQFLTDLHHMIAEPDRAVVYFEVPNAAYMFNNRATWSVYYEQYGHFTEHTLANLFNRCGFEVLDSGSCYEEGQYIYVEAKPIPGPLPADEPGDEKVHKLPEELQVFADAQRSNIEFWQRRLDDLRLAEKQVVTWGSAGKGCSFLNLLNTHELVHYVVDINPDRQEKYIPGSAQKVVAPEFIAEYRPDVIIITNPIYEQEIKKQVCELGVSCEFMIV